MFFTDFEIAFDSIIHDYIAEILNLFNFGQDLKSWVNLFIIVQQVVFSIMDIQPNSFPFSEGYDKAAHYYHIIYMNLIVTKPTKWHVRTAKT